MPDITLSPIPFNGGTLSLTNQSSHICQIQTNKFFSLFGQLTPNYTFACTINVDNIKATTPVVAIGKQRVMNQVALTRARVWKLTSNRVLALVNTDLVVYEVDAVTDDISQRVATSLAFHSTVLWGTEVAGTLGTGEFLHGQTIKDNVVWFFQRTSTTSAITLVKVVYDPVADTLTKSIIQTYAAATTATHLWRFFFQKFPGTNQWLVYGHGLNTTWATCTISSAFVYDEDGTLVKSITTGIPTTIRALVPMNSTRIIGLVDTRTWRYYDGTLWSTADIFFAGAATASTTIIEAEAIDENYFMTATTTTGIEIGSGTYSYRISRVVDSVFGQTSTATNTANGISYATLNAYFDQNMLIKSDAEAYVNFGRASTTAFRIRILRQLGA